MDSGFRTRRRADRLAGRGSRIPPRRTSPRHCEPNWPSMTWSSPNGEVARISSQDRREGLVRAELAAEYGGLGLGAVYQHLLMSEFEYWGVPGPDLTVTSVAPMIMRHGTEQNKTRMASADRQRRNDLRGRLFRARSRNRPGQPAHPGDARRRGMGDQRHQDLEQRGAARHPRMALCAHRSQCGPPSRDFGDHRADRQPGMEIRPLYAWSGYRTNEVHFDDVRVPVSESGREVNRGWTYITGALDLERGALTNAGDLRRAVDELTELARRPRRDGIGARSRCRPSVAGWRRPKPMSRWPR